MDLSLYKAISIGGVAMKKLAINGVQIWKKPYVNWARKAIDTDGSIYNGVGYKDGYRVRSGGAEQESNETACTGFIPVSAGDVVRFSGFPWFTGTASQNALNASDANFTNLGQFTMGQNSKYGIFESTYSAYTASSIVEEKTGVWKWIVPPAASGIVYIRITACDYTNHTATGKDMIVTINEEIE